MPTKEKDILVKKKPVNNNEELANEKPGETMVLKPDALHVMLVGLKAPLKDGERFPLTLRFARGGEVTVDVAVGKAGAMGPPK